jgi:predicted Zn-dependent peptidase
MLRKIALLFVLCSFIQPVAARDNAPAQAAIPARPEKLEFPPLTYDPPVPADYRVQLKSGPVAYVVPDRELPLVNIVVYVRTGDYLQRKDKLGIASLTGYMLSRGGTASKSAEEMEERLAFLAAQLNSGVGDTQGSVSLNLLAKDIEEGLNILRETLTAPRFQEDRLALRKQQILQGMKTRNDESAAIEAREASFLAFGEQFWVNQLPVTNTVNSITQADLQQFHRRWFHPANFIVAVSGDFDRDEMIQKLEKLFANWPFKGETPGPVPADAKFASPGVYIVDKEVNQGRVSIMLPGIRRDNPDYFPVVVMNDILGGGGFTSRIMNRVRSDEGLAYSAGSSFPGGVYYPLTFSASFQTKSRTVPYATSIVIQELRRMRDELVSEQELTTSKQGWIERFPRSFSTKTQVANTFAQDEFTGRYAKDPEFWKLFRDRLKAVTREDVQRVARKYFNLEKAVIVVVGEKKDILQGHPDHDVKLAQLAGGVLVELPMRDPMTLKPMPKPAEKAASK